MRPQRRLLHLGFVYLGFIASFLASPTVANPVLDGVIGQDDRRILEEDEKIGHAIGRVNFARYSSRGLCTGTLVTPDKAITAGHCLFDARTKEQVPTGLIHFVAGKRHSSFQGHSIVKSVTFLDGFDFQGERNFKFLTHDVVVLHLEKKLDIPPIPISNASATNGQELSHILYSRDRPHLPAIHKGCKVTGIGQNLWRTDCDTNFGGSGGPVLVEENGKTVLGAVMVGINPKRSSFAVPAAVWRHLIED